MQDALGDDQRVEFLDKCRGHRAQAADEFVRIRHAFHQTPRHDPVGAVAEQNVPALHEAIFGKVVPNEGAHAGRGKGGLEDEERNLVLRLVLQRFRHVGQACEHGPVVRAQPVLVGLDADQDDIGVRKLREIMGRAEQRPRRPFRATIRSRSGSIPPMTDLPELMALTFQPDVGELRWTTSTRAGLSVPILIRALASMAAMGMPTMPGPMTAIFSIFQFSGVSIFGFIPFRTDLLLDGKCGEYFI